MPIVDKRSVRAPSAKQSSGSAVIKPALTKSSAWPTPSLANVPWPLVSSHRMYPTANGDITSASAATETAEDTRTCFLSSP